jgi:hypothetical protein
MLERSLSAPTFIGAGVDDLAKEYLISSATLDQNSNSAIFTTFNGPALVYDYLIQQWSTWTNHQAVDSVNFGDSFTFCKPNGQVYKQNRDIFYDGYLNNAEVPYSLELISPWLSYSQVLGYQSVFSFWILGQYRGAHDLAVSVGYNFNPAFSDHAVIPATSLPGSNVWGADGYWGQSTPWGGEYQPYIFQVNMKTQKCTSFRIRIADDQSAPYTAGYTISSLLFEVGQVGGGYRVKKTNAVGVR